MRHIKTTPPHPESRPPDVEALPVRWETHATLRNAWVSIHQGFQALCPSRTALDDPGQIGDHHQRVIKPAVIASIEEAG